MAQPGEFGDHITLWAAAQKFNVQIAVISSLGDNYNVSIPVSNFLSESQGAEYSVRNSINSIMLGHFGEDNGAHYVCLKPSGQNSMDKIMATRFKTSHQSSNNELAQHAEQSAEVNPIAATSISHGNAVHSLTDLLQETVTTENKSEEPTQPARLDSNVEIPNCWSHDQYMYFKKENPWLTVANKRLGCSTCKSIKSLGPKTT